MTAISALRCNGPNCKTCVELEKSKTLARNWWSVISAQTTNNVADSWTLATVPAQHFCSEACFVNAIKLIAQSHCHETTTPDLKLLTLTDP
jgi:NAD-dependent dihydropyrimidine dehydrogenase PreA subunit